MYILPFYIYIYIYISLYTHMLNRFNHVQLFVTLWAVARQAPLSMGILQARIMEWVVMPSSRGSSQTRNGTRVFCIVGGFFLPAELPGKPCCQMLKCSSGISPIWLGLLWRLDRVLFLTRHWTQFWVRVLDNKSHTLPRRLWHLPPIVSPQFCLAHFPPLLSFIPETFSQAFTR